MDSLPLAETSLLPRLELAYRSGIFPWYEGQYILWWCPDPRFVIFPNELRVSKSMQQLIKKDAFRFTINKAFREVISNCQQINTGRAGRNLDHF